MCMNMRCGCRSTRRGAASRLRYCRVDGVDATRRHRERVISPRSQVPLPLDLPAEVNKHEAHAYAQWLSQETGQTLRLPTECEYHLMLEANDGCTLAKARENESIDAVAMMGHILL